MLTGEISIVETKVRGSGQTTHISEDKSDAKLIKIPHIPVSSTILAHEFQTDESLELVTVKDTVKAVVKKHLVKLQRVLDATLELHRVGAICGKTIDRAVQLFTISIPCLVLRKK